MNYDTATEIFEAIKTKESPLKRDVVLCAIRYARIRTDWRLLAIHERKALDPARTAAHNALIDATNILSRVMVKAGEDTTWRRQLGNERLEIGDWACHIHACLGIQAR
jgi:hypothetical protein